jgi:hypothetical protein
MTPKDVSPKDEERLPKEEEHEIDSSTYELRKTIEQYAADLRFFIQRLRNRLH